MAKGERRYRPPFGYISSTEAIKRLGKSLYRYVEEGRIEKLVPKGHKHGFYREADIDAILAYEQVFTDNYKRGQWRNHPTTTFERATEADIPTIIDIDSRTFGIPAAPIEISLQWLLKCPESFYVLRNQEGNIVGYESHLFLTQDTIKQFIRDEIDIIPASKVEDCQPGKPLHMYVLAIAIDPTYKGKQKHEYGSSIVRGLFSYFLELGERGIDIETITARSYKPDGLRLLRKMGIPQLKSPVPGKCLFSVNVKESGFSLFEQYTKHLEDWKTQNLPMTA